MSLREREYQPHLIKRIEKEILPGSYVRKIDAQQGWPDLLILWRIRWALLEVKVKKPRFSDFEPNQLWWIDEFNSMSFAACIYPENEEEVLNALSQTLRSSR